MSRLALSKSVSVGCPPAEAFLCFTADLAAWWPLQHHSVFGDEAAGCALEAWAGGRLLERSAHGGEALWGQVLLIEPGRRLVFTWHPGRLPASAQEVRVHFVASEGGTRVELEHLGWEALGERAAEARQTYDVTWDQVLVEGFAAHVRAAHHRPHELVTAE